jgi:hypothetical protein
MNDSAENLVGSDMFSNGEMPYFRTLTFSPDAYRHFAPTGGCLYKELLDLYFPFVNISLKPNLNAVEKGYLLRQYVIFSHK